MASVSLTVHRYYKGWHSSREGLRGWWLCFLHHPLHPKKCVLTKPNVKRVQSGRWIWHRGYSKLFPILFIPVQGQLPFCNLPVFIALVPPLTTLLPKSPWFPYSQFSGNSSLPGTQLTTHFFMSLCSLDLETPFFPVLVYLSDQSLQVSFVDASPSSDHLLGGRVLHGPLLAPHLCIPGALTGWLQVGTVFVWIMMCKLLSLKLNLLRLGLILLVVPQDPQIKLNSSSNSLKLPYPALHIQYLSAWYPSN